MITFATAIAAWFLLSVPLGLLMGRMLAGVSRDYAAHNGQDVAPISTKSSPRLVAKLGRDALSIVRSPSSGGR